MLSILSDRPILIDRRSPRVLAFWEAMHSRFVDRALSLSLWLDGRERAVDELTPRRDEESERALIRRVSIDRDELAFKALYELFFERLYRFIVRIGYPPDQAEDALNETMLVVWEKAGTFNYQSKLSTWIFGIAYRKVLKLKTNPSVRETHVPLDEHIASLPGHADVGARIAELEDWLNVALESLPSEQRAVIELTYYHELSYKDVAEILQCPESTVKTRVFHARRKLYGLLEDLRVNNGTEG